MLAELAFKKSQEIMKCLEEALNENNFPVSEFEMDEANEAVQELLSDFNTLTEKDKMVIASFVKESLLNGIFVVDSF